MLQCVHTFNMHKIRFTIKNVVGSIFANFAIFTLFIGSAFLVYSIGVNITSAQSASISSYDGISIESNPEKPEAGQAYTLNAQSFTTDLNRANIIWYLDGKTVDSGEGHTKISLIAPKNGTTQTVIAVITTFEKKVVRKVFTVTPASIDLVWESDGIVSPLYPGRSAYATGGNLRVTALPTFYDSDTKKQIPPSSLVYKWSKGDTVLQDQSGKGKQTAIITPGNLDEDIEVSVEVTSENSKISGRSALNITPVNPVIKFYVDSPLYGLLTQKSISQTALKDDSIKIRAVPFYSSKSGVDSAETKYSWTVNNISHAELNGYDSINLTKNGSSAEGSTVIRLNIDNPRLFFQSTSADFSVYFGSGGN